MDVWSCFGLLVLVYSIFYLTDAILRSKCSFIYLKALRWSGIDIGLFQIRWFTERFNNTLTSFGRSCPGFLSAWFLIGAIISSLLIIPAISLLVITLVGQLSKAEGEDRVVIHPVLPGVNVPNSELGYYFLSLLVCSIYHEVGHAMAAASENVRVLGFGVFVLFVIPAAYVELPTDQLRTKSSLQQLRVFSAGVWHNIILVCFSLLVIQSLPVLSSPFYRHGSSVCVTHVNTMSSVTGPSGITPGDEIVSISGAKVSNKDDVRKYIISAIQEANCGYCIPSQRLWDSASGIAARGSYDRDCCHNSSANSLCFEFGESTTSCLEVRQLLVNVNRTCLDTTECSDNEVCVRPVFTSNTTKLVRMERRNAKDFLFVGNPALIYTSVQLSDYCPMLSFLSADLPDVMLKLCNYLLSFSGALAVLNVIPSLLLDGQHMMKVILELLLKGDLAKYRNKTQLTLTLIGTGLVIANIGAGFLSLLATGSTNPFWTAAL